MQMWHVSFGLAGVALSGPQTPSCTPRFFWGGAISSHMSAFYVCFHDIWSVPFAIQPVLLSMHAKHGFGAAIASAIWQLGIWGPLNLPPLCPPPARLLHAYRTYIYLRRIMPSRSSVLQECPAWSGERADLLAWGRCGGGAGGQIQSTAMHAGLPWPSPRSHRPHFACPTRW